MKGDGFFIGVVVVLSTLFLSAVSSLLDDLSFWTKMHGNSIITTGTVVGLKKGFVSIDSITTYEVAYWVNKQGFILSTTIHLDLNDRDDYNIGDKIDIIYSAEQPTLARPFNFWTIEGPLILEIVGVVVPAFVVFLMIRRRKSLGRKK